LRNQLSASLGSGTAAAFWDLAAVVSAAMAGSTGNVRRARLKKQIMHLAKTNGRGIMEVPFFSAR
jgi:hypothetical protein